LELGLISGIEIEFKTRSDSGTVTKCFEFYFIFLGKRKSPELRVNWQLTTSYRPPVNCWLTPSSKPGYPKPNWGLISKTQTWIFFSQEQNLSFPFLFFCETETGTIPKLF
jgi:hypothetical protein